MSRVGQIKAYNWTSGGQTYKVFAKPGGLSKFIAGLQEASQEETTSTLQTVGGYTRRNYPGGPGIAVGNHSRIVLQGGDLPGRALPGQNAYFEVTTGTGTARKTTVTTVTFTGSFTDFHSWVTGASTGGFVLRSPDGVRYPIASNNLP